MSRTRAQEPLNVAPASYTGFKAIHKHLFQDVYDWAGEPRTVDLARDESLFAKSLYIDREMNRIFTELNAENALVGLDFPAFARRAAYFLSEINAVHPFRDGNGRTQLTWLTMLAEHAGFTVDATGITRDRVVPAMIASFNGNLGPLEAFIASILRPGP